MPRVTVHIGRTLGLEVVERQDGSSLLAWEAVPEYGFPTAGGQVLHGGMVSWLLDSAMGHACWSVLSPDEVFLTADLRVEFYRATRMGRVTAKGSVVTRTRRLVFCSAELFDAQGRLLASGRCTQTVLPGEGHAGRSDPGAGLDEDDARG
ncbi:MAG: PaaI family thioesterase [Mycobacteriales bacterium]